MCDGRGRRGTREVGSVGLIGDLAYRRLRSMNEEEVLRRYADRVVIATCNASASTRSPSSTRATAPTDSFAGVARSDIGVPAQVRRLSGIHADRSGDLLVGGRRGEGGRSR